MKSAFVYFGLFLAASLAGTPARAAGDIRPKAAPAPAQFSPAEIPAERDGAALVTLPAPGRYAIRAKSASGARLELVDMMAGPLESAGVAGARDGRIDALLDKGVYKVRVGNAAGASGKVRLTADPFVEAEGERSILAEGKIVTAQLGDLQQRSYAVEVGAAGKISIEAAGRALQDLRLWRAGGELVDLSPQKRGVEPKPGKAMTLLRLEGAVEPGAYVVTAYGGEPRVAPDGDAALPFFIRLAPPFPLIAGLYEGVIGPFGVARFEAPAADDAFHLELKEPGAAIFEAQRGKSAKQTAAIDKTSREPSASLRLAAGDAPTLIEISGAEGRKFSLRALRQSDRFTFEGSGRHVIGFDLAGEGGDEVPATAVLARVENEKLRVLASDMPRIGAGSGYRAKFNLHGVTSLLFETIAAGPIVVAASGPKVRARIEPALGGVAPRADGKTPSRYDLAAGHYILILEPENGAVGVIDVTLAPPGVVPPPAPRAAPRSFLSFGEQTLEKSASYLILANVGPSLFTGPRIVPSPYDLDKGPLALWQEANKPLTVNLRAPKDAKIIARDSTGAIVALSLRGDSVENDVRTVAAVVAPSAAARAIGFALAPGDAKPAKADAAPGDDKDKEKAARKSAPLVAAPGKPVYFDLARDETKRLRFDVAKGGLYRIETLGRLKTEVEFGTNFTPHIAKGEDNGPGHNGLVTAYLRAGAYRVAVTAKESSGRLGLAITPAGLEETPALAASGSVFASLAPGRGAVAPIAIADDGLYRLDLAGVGRQWRARLEDAEGWPLTAPGVVTRLTRKFEKGAYRLVALPEDVEGRMAARLARIAPKPELSGHGPHDLAFGVPAKLQWREPQGKDAARAPDLWRFSLAGDAEITLTIGEGMIGEIVKGEKEVVGKASGGRAFTGKLGAGAYRVEARSLARDDRLDYEISLDSVELQPGAPRYVDLPTTLNFALAQASLVDLSSFGDKETRGVLKDASGAVVGEASGGAADWNASLARRLPAGAYRLELSEIGAPPSSDESGGEEGEAQDADAQHAEGAAEDDAPQGTEIRFALPREQEEGALAPGAIKTLTGAAAHLLGLPAAGAGRLALVSARSVSEVALSLEKRGADGVWRVAANARGLAPFVAIPGEAETAVGAWRVAVWSVGAAAAPIDVAAFIVDRRSSAPGAVTLASVEGAPSPLCAGLVALPVAALARVSSAAPDLFVGATPGVPLAPLRSDAIAPQSPALWLVARGDCKEKAQVAPVEWSGDDMTVALGAGESVAATPSAARSGKTRVWIARSGFADVGLDAGGGGAIAETAAVALGDAPPRLSNAFGAETARAALRLVELEPRAGVSAPFSGLLPPMSATPIALGDADAPLSVDLPPNVALTLSAGAGAFGDEASVSRVLHGARGVAMLLNLSDAPAPARIVRLSGKPDVLAAGGVFARFFGAVGQIALPVDGASGDRLSVIGAKARFVSAQGAVSRGTQFALAGKGELLLDYAPGLVVAFIERGGKLPWPEAAPRAVEAGKRVALEGKSMRLTLRQSAPGVLSLKSASPALLAVAQNGARRIEAFANGVAFESFLAAGEATIDLFAPGDAPLSGALEIAARSPLAAHEGVNDAVALAPGESALFSFETTRDGEIGVGLRAEPDRVALRVIDANGKTLGEGQALQLKLAPGRYFAEARLPADAPPAVARLSVLGLSPPPATPPEEVVADYLERAGLKKSHSR